jgi:hypothetical protein
MKVYFPGPMPETYHPKLRRLVKDEVFDLADDQAEFYIAVGLLKKAETKKSSRAAGKE